LSENFWSIVGRTLLPVDAVQVETTNTQLGDVIDQKKILELPLNGRSFIDLFGLQPGVAPASARNEGEGTISVNGQRENSNGFLVNGGDVSGAANFEAGVEQNLDSIQEFHLITNSFDAEYGRFSGALMNTITKSGTNSIHGTAFEFLRNSLTSDGHFFRREKAYSSSGIILRHPAGPGQEGVQQPRRPMVVHSVPVVTIQRGPARAGSTMFARCRPFPRSHRHSSQG